MSSVLSGALATLFAAAVVGKSQDMPSFARYLAPLSSRHATSIARGVLVAEAALVVILLLGAVDVASVGIAGAAAGVFLVVAACVQAVLVLNGDGGRCNCFGPQSARHGALPGPRDAIAGTRNAVLVGFSWYAATNGLAVACIAGSVASCITAAGLVGAIVQERKRIGSENNALIAEYASRVARLQAHQWWLNGRPRPLS